MAARPFNVPTFRLFLGGLVAFMWAFTLVADVLSKEFTQPPPVSGALIAVMTWAFGSAIRDQVTRKNGGSNGE